MRVFLDSNVLVDVALQRKTGNFEEAMVILEACEKRYLEGYISPASIYLLVFILKKSGFNVADIRSLIEKMLKFLVVLPISNKEFSYSLTLDMADLEDSLQLSSAYLEAGIQYLVTSNIRDFPRKHGKLNIIHPIEFVDKFVS